MILNNAINAGGFIYCMAYFGPNESVVYQNIGHGHYHQYFYIVEGSATAIIRDTEHGEPVSINNTKQPGTLVDQRYNYGKWTNVVTKDESISMMFFNPIPDTRDIKVEILKGSETHTITAIHQRKTLVCITGPIKANSKDLTSLQYSKILPGKTVELTLPENTVCAIVSE
jgi:hypothetical protein